MTYANHRVTEITENAQRSLHFDRMHSGVVPWVDANAFLRASSVPSVSPWLAYVISRGCRYD